MADVVRDVVIRLNMESGTAEIKAPDLGPVVDTLKEEVAIRTEAESLIKTQAESAKMYESAVEDGVAATLKLQDATKQMLGAVDKVGTGFLTLARAGALLGTDTDEDLKKLLENLIQIQAAMDLFKGTKDVLEGVIDSVKAWHEAGVALQTATEAQTIAQTANTASRTANATAVAGSTAASASHTAAMVVETSVMATLTATAVGLWAALWPIAAIAAAIGGVVAVGVGAWKLWNAEAVAAEEAAEALRIEEERLAKVQDAQVAATTRQVRRTADLEKQLRGMLPEKERLIELENQDLEVQLQKLAQEEKALKGTENEARDLELILAQREAILSKLQEQHSLQDGQNKATEDAIKKREAELQLAQKTLQASREALELEKQKTDSLEEQFARKSFFVQEEIKRADKAIQEGKGTSEDAAFLESEGFGSKESRALLAESAKERGSGELSVIKNRRATEATKAAGIEKDTEQLAQDKGKFDKAKEKTLTDAKKLMDDLNELISKGLKQTNSLKQRQDEIDVAEAGRAE